MEQQIQFIWFLIQIKLLSIALTKSVLSSSDLFPIKGQTSSKKISSM